jgi:hypothetical protein
MKTPQVRGMVLSGKHKIAHVIKKTMEHHIKGNVAQVKYSVRYTICKTVTTTVQSPVKVSTGSRRLTHSTEGILNGEILIQRTQTCEH